MTDPKAGDNALYYQTDFYSIKLHSTFKSLSYLTTALYPQNTVLLGETALYPQTYFLLDKKISLNNLTVG